MNVLNGITPRSIDEAVLFPFDAQSLPFQRDLILNLQSGRTNKAEMDYGHNIDMDDRHPEGPVLTYGPPGSLDSTEILCPQVFFIDGEYRMWYTGGDDNRKRHEGLYATSKDGFNWERPNLRLTEVNGNKQNNKVAGPCGEWVMYDPEDPDPKRRFKSLFYSGAGAMRVSTSFSADGLNWERATENGDLFGTGIEAGNICKWGDCYYINGQGGPSPMNRPIPHPIKNASKRIVVTFASYDFINWTHAAAMSLRRDPIPPRAPESFDAHSGEQIHEGIATWNRGNLLVGLYGQYRSPTNDRRDVILDLGFAISHDALHFNEPIPGFKMVHSYEIRGHHYDSFAAPRLIQRNAWANIGDRTVYWYSIWREESSTWNAANPKSFTGVWVATWERDRFGWIAPCPRNYGSQAGEHLPHCISCPVELKEEGKKLYVNADRLGDYAELQVEILDKKFRPLPGYSGNDCIPVNESGLRQQVRWKDKDTLEKFDHPIRVQITWGGVRVEDPRLFALYLS